MIKFSILKQAFYDSELDYAALPSDLIEITAEQHLELLNLINSGCIIFQDLTASEPKPSPFHIWNSESNTWADPRTQAEIEVYERSLLTRLTKRQFALQLNSVQVGEATLYKQMLALIVQDETAQIEWDTVSYIERLSPTVASMTAALGLTDEQVDEMWREALMR